MDDGVNLIGPCSVLYLGGSFTLHRIRLARLRRDGLELPLLRRLHRSQAPAEIQEAIDRAQAAQTRNASWEVEKQARAALAAIRQAGGRRSSASLAYLDAHVRLTYLPGPINLEWVGLSGLIALKRALRRFGPAPELHLALAHARTLLGQLPGALDELGRAVYYAHGEPFFTRLVLDSEYVTQARPGLRQQCLERAPAEG